MRSGKNNLEEAKFYHNDKSLGKLKMNCHSQLFLIFCGTDHFLFKSHYNNCTHWSCVLRIYKCNGQQYADKGYMLRINKDASQSFGIDKSLTEWNRFVVETMKPVLKF